MFRLGFAGMIAAVVLATGAPASAEDAVWRHGTIIPKGDAGFIYMAAEGGFAKQRGLDLKMLAFQSDTLMFKALIDASVREKAAARLAQIH